MKYLCDPQIIPGVIPQSAGEFTERAVVLGGFAQWIHLDICDGVFTTDKNWPLDIAALPSGVNVEVHLMVAEPLQIGLDLIKAGAKRIVAHRESFADTASLEAALAAWKAAGASEVGVALLLQTPLSEINSVADHCDFVQLMSIAKVGHQGEAFDDLALSRVEELHAAYPEMMVSVDGGISEATVEQLVRAGANRIVVGHVILESDTPDELYARMHERAMLGCKPVTIEMGV